MNLDRYLILANSRKEGGRCIAGVDAGGAWVRPVSGEGTGELRSNQCLNSQGDALLPLDVVSATFGESVASNYQPEDFISLNEWKAADPITPDELHNWLELTVDHTADFLAMGSMDRISATSAQSDPLQSSLALVRPDEVRLWRTQSIRGRRQLRVVFTCSDVCDEGGQPIQFSLVVTDDVLEKKAWELTESELHLRTDVSEEPVYLTVSLGVPFNASHYKLVAAVTTQHDVSDASNRNTGITPF
jgi:hypothetical protein